jgi:DNA modification methylase
MIPARVALALQADGWYLRDEIIWHKPNPMPSSVTDRTTPAHEMVYLLTKSARYWYDADAIATDAIDGGKVRTGPIYGAPASAFGIAKKTGNMADDAVWVTPARSHKRSVWTVATQPYPDAHFATFPEALIEPMVLAGCPDRVCVECGAPWERVVERDVVSVSPSPRYAGNGDRNDSEDGRTERAVRTTGWRPTCTHDAPTRPGTVLDPFAGSGTTGLVAQRLSRRAVLIDLSMDYLAQIMDRNRDIPLGLGA